ncbi:type II toxin-antitoxin system death-on-curing family toxin [Paenibacillus polymyxa]|uniref:type II toxin-antitoxin system death-on-curing family toxin n=1 Tax=Paenibacillus polymyxa TaxID=1406 RepID=UPI0032AEDFDC
MVRRLTVEQIIAIHDEELRQSNGLSGIKEPGYLEFISQKPFGVVFGMEQYPGLFLKAAVLMYSLITSHCFFDANKRTGVLCTYIFLNINGVELDADQDDLFDMAIKVANKQIDEKQLSHWLENNSYRF